MVDKLSPGGTAASNDENSLPAWPGWVVVAIVVMSAIYSFSPRPKPDFPPSGLKSDRVHINDVTRSNTRLVAVGEQGTLLLADDPRGPWRQADIEKNRGSTLTRVVFLDGGVVLAVGHDSWILRSQDRGANWSEVRFDSERSEPLLGLAGPFAGKLYAFGAFGQFLVSRDNGLGWQSETLVEEGGKAKPQAQVSDDPLAMFATAADIGGGLTGSHLNDMERAGDGSLILVGERGLIARSTNNGESWRVLPQIYSGSFYGILTLRGDRLLIHGMRGHVFYSDDFGQTWKQSKVPIANSLFGGAVQGDGDAVLVGASNAMLLSQDNGESFLHVSKKGPHGLAAILPLENEELLKVGEGGLALVSLGGGGEQAGE
jgi:photosystem II stability/assembly factor-like uncharacterized protein